MAMAGLVVVAVILGVAVVCCPRRLELGGGLLALLISGAGTLVEGAAFGLTLGALIVVSVAILRSMADTSQALREPRRELLAERRRRERQRQRQERLRRHAAAQDRESVADSDARRAA
jgi:hypothetical protein